MSAARVAGVAIAAAGAGLLLTMWWRTVSDPPAPGDGVAPVGEVSPDKSMDDCPALEPRQEQLAALDLRASAARARIGTLEQERSDIAGDPTPWAEDAPMSLEQVEAGVIDAADAAGLALQELDCSEEPCTYVASFHIPDGAPFGDVSDHYTGAFQDALGDMELRYNSYVREGADGGRVYSLFGSVHAGDGPPPPDDARTRFRQEALNNLVQREVFDGDREEILPGVWPPEDADDSVDPAPGGE